MRILLIGDICGRSGRSCVARWLPELREKRAIDIVFANAENAAGGLGATAEVLAEILALGVQGITMGNHTWRQKGFAEALDSLDAVVRPANYPPDVPGKGAQVFELPDGRKVGIINLVGRVFMEPFDCPFRRGRDEVMRLRELTPVVVVDFHAEATSEKKALGWYLDGLCTAVLGTHTHVMTADERVLPHGTAYITDVGMTGPADSVIGVDTERAIHKFVTGLPSSFRVAKGPTELCAVLVEADDQTGKALSIERIVCTEENAVSGF